MTNELLSRIQNDFVDNERIFKEIKDDLISLVKTNDNNNEFDITYDDFCIRCLENIKNKNLNSNLYSKSNKQYFIESILQIACDELEKRGRINESKNILKYGNSI